MIGASDTVLILRYCRADRTAHGGFKWPESGPVECHDWQDDGACGHGLHGWLWGEGDASAWEHRPDDLGLVVEVRTEDVRDLRGKIKYPRGVVVYCGTRHGAADYVLAHGGHGRAVIGAIVSAGTRGTATAGDYGTATAGDRGTAKAGDDGTAKAGYGGTAKAGDRGTAEAGDGGTATAGDGGTAKAGYGGTAKAGYGGTLQLSLWDSTADRRRIRVAYVGEDGVEPGVAYRLDSSGAFVRAVQP